MQTISWWDAWFVWFSGHEVPGDAFMGPLTILTWGRIGKVAGFLGGATVVLDLAGPDRLRELGVKASAAKSDKTSTGQFLSEVAGAGFAIGPVIIICMLMADWLDIESATSIKTLAIVAAGALMGVGALAAVVSIFLIGVARMMDRRNPAIFLRYLGLLILVGGFHLDLLAS